MSILNLHCWGSRVQDEENMNLKEKLRAEIRRELTKLEMSCIDMPSLLRGLGIHVGSSPSPVSQEASATSLLDAVAIL